MLDTILLDYPLTRQEAPPAYSFDLCSGEQRLEITPRHGSSHTPQGSIIKKFGKVTLILPRQEDGAQIPSYGRNDVIEGVFCFDDPSRITKVAIKIRGEAETMTGSSAKTTRLIDDSYTLWQSANADDSSCPYQLEFNCALPSTFIQGNEAKSLPPSFHFFDPGFYVKTYYRVFIEITRKRRSRFDFSSSVKRYSVPFKYWPKSRPIRPFETTPCFLSSVKTTPEEWHQTTSTLKTSCPLARETLHCHFFVPSVRIFGLSDNIPFHIQLNGPISSLRDFFPPDALQRVGTADTSLSAPSIRPPKSARGRFEVQRHSVRVQILQQAVAMDDGRKLWRNSTIGEGVVHPLPPPLYRDRCLGTREESLDWEGSVKCNDDVKVGSFSIGLFHVHHFMSLTLTPPDVRKSPFLVLNIYVPVKLVTESYQEFG